MYTRKILLGEAIALASGCKGCPRGEWSSGFGLTKEALCKTCETGKYGRSTVDSADSESSCVQCDRGKYLATVGAFGSESCIGCALDFVKSLRSSILPAVHTGKNSSENVEEPSANFARRVVPQALLPTMLAAKVAH